MDVEDKPLGSQAQAKSLGQRNSEEELSERIDRAISMVAARRIYGVSFDIYGNPREDPRDAYHRSQLQTLKEIRKTVKDIDFCDDYTFLESVRTEIEARKADASKSNDGEEKDAVLSVVDTVLSWISVLKGGKM